MLFSQRAGWSQQFVSVISWGVRRLLVWCEGLPHIRESGQWPAVCKQRVISTPPGWRHIHYNRLPPLCLPLQPSQLIRSSPLYDHFHMTIRDHPHPPLLSRTITDHWSILPPSFAPFHCPPPQASDFDWTNESWTKCSSGEIISEAVVALVNWISQIALRRNFYCPRKLIVVGGHLVHCVSICLCTLMIMSE